MKRDMDLIRLLMLQTEGEEPRPDLSGYTQAKVLYHYALLIEANLVHGSIIPDKNGDIGATNILRLTWAGHEFLDAARNDTIWKKSWQKITNSGVQVTMTVLEDLLKSNIKEVLGLS